MSGASLSNEQLRDRALRAEERALIRSLLSGVFEPGAAENLLETSRVEDMDDGGMGGIRFVEPEPRSFGRTLAEAEYLDDDGVLVSIALNADGMGKLFELDFWKVDFSPLRRYPKPSELSIKHC
jgi:hypothetical protein